MASRSRARSSLTRAVQRCRSAAALSAAGLHRRVRWLDDDAARLRNEAQRPAGEGVCACAPEASPTNTRAHEIGAAEIRPAQVRSTEISPTKHRTRQVCATEIAAAEGNRREIGTTENGRSKIRCMEINAGEIRSGKVCGRQVGVRQPNVRMPEPRRQSDCTPRSAVPNKLENLASFHNASRFVDRPTGLQLQPPPILLRAYTTLQVARGAFQPSSRRITRRLGRIDGAGVKDCARGTSAARFTGSRTIRTPWCRVGRALRPGVGVNGDSCPRRGMADQPPRFALRAPRRVCMASRRRFQESPRRPHHDDLHERAKPREPRSAEPARCPRSRRLARQSCSSLSASGGRLCSRISSGPASRGGGADALT